MWFVLALLSAVFAALTSILAKVGIEGVNSNLATAIRTMVVLIMAWGMVFATHAQSGISSIMLLPAGAAKLFCLGALKPPFPAGLSPHSKNSTLSATKPCLPPLTWTSIWRARR